MEAEWFRICEEMRKVEAQTSGANRFVFGKCPEFWKGAGDEVLFSKVVESPLDAAAAVHTLLAVMREQRLQFASKHPQLNVKGAAWLAGFPANNAEIILPYKEARLTAGRLDDALAENYRLLSMSNSGSTRTAFHADYIGPSVDLGFRLRDHATPRRMVVSVDLVWLLCHAHDRCFDDERSSCAYLHIPNVGYDGRHGLRGILGGEPYPLMWIEADSTNALDNAEDTLLRRKSSGTPLNTDEYKALKDFCSTFLNNQGPLRSRPYISGWHEAVVGTIPDDHKQYLDKLRGLIADAQAQLQSLAVKDPRSGSIPYKARKFASGLATEIAPRATTRGKKKRASAKGARKKCK